MNIKYACSFKDRLIGLLGTNQFPDYEGLFFPDVNCIHTFFMQYPIDVLFLDKDHKVLKIKGKVRPFRIVWGKHDSCDVLEMKAGASEQMNIKIGDILNLEGK